MCQTKLQLDSSHVFSVYSFEDTEDGFSIGGKLNGIGFWISVSPESFTNSPQALQNFQVALQQLRDGTEDDEFWEFAYDVAHNFLPQLLKLAPPEFYKGNLTLADTLTRCAYEADYKVVNEKPIETSLSICVREPASLGHFDMRKLQDAFPIVDPASVEVAGNLGVNIFRGKRDKLFLNGEKLFYKSFAAPYDAVAEVKKYCKISSSGQQLRISHLHSIVANRHGQTIGLLYSWIPTDRGDLSTLEWRVGPDTSQELRERWISQIRETVTALHELGLVWGDVCSRNVLIDTDDNAVVIGLQGGATTGWVDNAIMETAEGDLQGLGRLVDFIYSDNAKLYKLRKKIEDEGEEETED